MENFTFTNQQSIQLREFLKALNKKTNALVLPQRVGDVSSLQDLKKRLGPYTYITLTNLNAAHYPDEKLRIVVGGVEKYLGYSEEEFDFKKSMAIIFDIFRIIVIEYGKAAYKLLQKESVRKKITQDTFYTISYLVRHANSDQGLLQVTQHSSPFIQHDDGNIAVQINVCHIHPVISASAVMTKPFFTHPCRGYLDKELQQIQDIAIPNILAQIRKQNNNRPLLSPREFELARLFCEGYSSNAIAKQHLDLSVDTVRRHCSNMLNKIRKWFPDELSLPDGPQTARYLKNLGFLDYPKCFEH